MLAISSRVAAPAASGMSLSASSSATPAKRAATGKLGFYRAHPVEKIELDDFEQYAIDRLQGKGPREKTARSGKFLLRHVHGREATS